MISPGACSPRVQSLVGHCRSLKIPLEEGAALFLRRTLEPLPPHYLPHSFEPAKTGKIRGDALVDAILDEVAPSAEIPPHTYDPFSDLPPAMRQDATSLQPSPLDGSFELHERTKQVPPLLHIPHLCRHPLLNASLRTHTHLRSLPFSSPSSRFFIYPHIPFCFLYPASLHAHLLRSSVYLAIPLLSSLSLRSGS